MVILVVGGSNEIGIELAKRHSIMGDIVISTYYKNSMPNEYAENIKLDITNENEIDKVIKEVIIKYGRIDIIYCLAAIYMDNSFLNKTKKEFMKVLEVNLVGTFLINQIYSRYIDNGLIVNIASTDGIDTGSEYNIDYSASKAGIINMTRGISLGTSNRVISISPNWVDTYSTRSMDKNYLNNELERIGQSRLLMVEEVVDGIKEIIDYNDKWGNYRIDIKEDKLWIEKMQ